MTTGANIASAAEKRPKRKSPPPPKRDRASPQRCSMRSISARTCGVMPLPGWLDRMFMGMFARRLRKPACISAQAERAKARASGSSGQTPRSGNHSATVSAMASVSQTATPPRHRTGTSPEGDRRPMPASHSSVSKRSFLSSKSMPSWASSTQARIDHDE